MNETGNILELFPWITSSFVEHLIVKSENIENVTLTSFNAKKAFDKGEGFTSNIVALSTVFKKPTGGGEMQRSYLLKIAIQTDLYLKIADEIHTYDKEIEVYSKILPAITSILKERDTASQIGPRFVYLLVRVLILSG